MNAEWYEVREPGDEGPESWVQMLPSDGGPGHYDTHGEAREAANEIRHDGYVGPLWIARCTTEKAEDVPDAGFAKDAPRPILDRDLAIYFDPDAVREHFDGDEETLEGVTDDDLREAAKDAPHDEFLWKVVGGLLDEIGPAARIVADRRTSKGVPA
jgi:hypothetical protein